MAVNPIEQISLMRSVRARGIRTADLSDSDMLIAIDDCLNEYLMYRPKVTVSSTAQCITTIKDEPEYSLPDDALWVIDVCWNPDYDDSEVNDLYQEIIYSTWNTMDPTLVMIDNAKLSRLHREFRGHWEYKNDKIWLIPPPVTSGSKVAVVYASARTLSELDEIKDRRFLDLLYYSCLLSVGHKKITGGGWKAGAYQVDAEVGKQTVMVAEKGLDKVRLQIANSYGVRS